MAEIEDIMSSNKIRSEDERVMKMMSAEYGSELWTITTFSLLKEAGLTKKQALAWVLLEDEELTKEELLKERVVRYFIQTVYSDSI